MAKFSWKVPVKGYKWASDSVEDDELYLTPIEDWCSRHYAPSDECTGLFRTFATTLTTREGVLAFANRFGHLGFGGAGVGGDVDDEWELRSNEEWRRVDETAKNEINMENFAAWCQQIKWLRQCVETWDAAQSGR
ncbi:MAG TPA: hypothetical protein VF221_09010, partial [Chloroflexota bacterium]